MPFLEFPVELRKVVYTTNAIESLNARFRRAVRHRGHFPNEQSALKVLYLVATQHRPNRANMTGKIHGWKQILNALTVHYGDRIAVTKPLMAVTTTYTKKLTDPSGGFDAIEGEFLFSYFPDEGDEFWFGVTLADVQLAIASRDVPDLMIGLQKDDLATAPLRVRFGHPHPRKRPSSSIRNWMGLRLKDAPC